MEVEGATVLMVEMLRMTYGIGIGKYNEDAVHHAIESLPMAIAWRLQMIAT